MTESEKPPNGSGKARARPEMKFIDQHTEEIVVNNTKAAYRLSFTNNMDNTCEQLEFEEDEDKTISYESVDPTKQRYSYGPNGKFYEGELFHLQIVKGLATFTEDPCSLFGVYRKIKEETPIIDGQTIFYDTTFLDLEIKEKEMIPYLHESNCGKVVKSHQLYEANTSVGNGSSGINVSNMKWKKAQFEIEIKKEDSTLKIIPKSDIFLRVDTTKKGIWKQSEELFIPPCFSMSYSIPDEMPPINN